MSKRFMKQLAVAGSGLLGAIVTAHAAVPAEVSTALSDGKADAMTVAGLALVIIIAIAAFKYMRKGV